MNEITPSPNALRHRTLFSIVCGAHFINHFQSSMLGVIYPLMMKELGMGYMAIASFAAVYNTLGSILQASYRFVIPYVRRGVILGTGNCILRISVIARGLTSSYQHFFVTRIFGGVGSSPQHQIGSSMLASHFATDRGKALAFHSTAGQMGDLLAPLLSAVAISWLGWRGLFWTVGALAHSLLTSSFMAPPSLRARLSLKPCLAILSARISLTPRSASTILSDFCRFRSGPSSREES